MPNNTYNDQVQDLVLSTTWSLWVELGLSGWTRRHSWTAIDLEPLIIATSYFGRSDARLLQETVDWCVANAGLVSAVRLRNQLKQATPAVASAFGNLAATVRAHTRVNWPGDGERLGLPLTHKSLSPDLARPSLVQLRLRAAFGVSVRAEILRLLMAEPGRFQGIAELATGAAYGKENVADALGYLNQAGIVEEAGSRNQRVYRLAHPIEFEAMAGPLPAENPDWAARFRVMLSFWDFSRSAAADPIVRASDIRILLRALQGDLARLGATWPLRLATGEALNEDYEGWSLQGLRGWAGSEGTPSTDEVAYNVHRLATKNWVGTINEPGQPERPIEMPEWAGLYQERPRSDMVVSDDSTGAPRLAHAMFQDAFKRTSVEIGPYWSDAPINQMMSREFAEERLWPMYPGSSGRWSDQFLRAWWADRKARLAGGTQSSGHPRSDSQFDSQSRRTMSDRGGRPRTKGGRAQIRSGRRRTSTDTLGTS
jgi:hypothetical protein